MKDSSTPARNLLAAHQQKKKAAKQANKVKSTTDLEARAAAAGRTVSEQRTFEFKQVAVDKKPTIVHVTSRGSEPPPKPRQEPDSRWSNWS